jgi:hypothetical protein
MYRATTKRFERVSTNGPYRLVGTRISFARGSEIPREVDLIGIMRAVDGATESIDRSKGRVIVEIEHSGGMQKTVVLIERGIWI